MKDPSSNIVENFFGIKKSEPPQDQTKENNEVWYGPRSPNGTRLTGYKVHTSPEEDKKKNPPFAMSWWGVCPMIGAQLKKEGERPDQAAGIAKLFDLILSYCQLDRKVCDASIQTLAYYIQKGRMTTHKYLKWLIEHNYVFDKTPDRKFKPHILIANDVVIEASHKYYYDFEEKKKAKRSFKM
jgi:hypothetical protein